MMWARLYVAEALIEVARLILWSGELLYLRGRINGDLMVSWVVCVRALRRLADKWRSIH